MQILEVNAPSDKEAIKIASERLNVDSDSLTVQLHKKGTGGFLGIGSKNPSLYRVFAIKDKTSEEVLIKGAIISVTEKMGYPVEINVIEKTEDGKTYVRISSDQAGYVIGKRGKTLEAIQLIVNLIIQQFSGDAPKILLDIENYRDRRAKYLTDIAQKLADAVRRTKKSRLLEPLNPYERRIVHMALQEDLEVETESEGTGVYKRVRIKHKNAGKEGNRATAEKNHDDIDAEYANDFPEEFGNDDDVMPENNDSAPVGSEERSDRSYTN